MSLDRPSAFVDSGRVVYARFQGNSEVDFLGPELGIPFESKYEDGPWKRGAQTMVAHYGRGVLATRTPLGIVGGAGSYEPVRALPTGLLVWLLGS